MEEERGREEREENRRKKRERGRGTVYNTQPRPLLNTHTHRDRKTDRQTDRQTPTHTHTYTHTAPGSQVQLHLWL